MLNRTMTASVLPREGRLRSVIPSWSAIFRRLADARYRSLMIQERIEADRIRYAERRGHRWR
jgi:hypothetical protein